MNYPDIGTVLCDMHGEFNIEALGLCRRVSRIEIRTSIGDYFIAKTIEEATGEPYVYSNKHLVVLGEERTTGYFLLAYSYNAAMLVIFSYEAVQE